MQVPTDKIKNSKDSKLKPYIRLLLLTAAFSMFTHTCERWYLLVPRYYKHKTMRSNFNNNNTNSNLHLSQVCVNIEAESVY